VKNKGSRLIDWFFVAVAHAFSAIVGVGFLVFFGRIDRCDIFIHGVS
jgi:hypothetical protein